MSSLNNIPLSAALLYILKVVLMSVERSDSLCKISSEDIVKFPGEPGEQNIRDSMAETYCKKKISLSARQLFTNYLLINTKRFRVKIHHLQIC